MGTDVGVRANTQGESGGLRRARFQPLLLLGATGTVLPALIDGRAQTLLVAAVVTLGSLSVVAWLAMRRTPSPWRHLPLMAGMAVLSIAAFVLVVSADGANRPEAYLLVAAALLCAFSLIPDHRMRLAVQFSVIATVGVSLGMADRALLDVVFPLAMLVIVLVLSNLFVAELIASRAKEVSARIDAERRAELLDTVFEFPGRDIAAAAKTTVMALRALAFDAAGVGLLGDDGRLHSIELDGLPDPAEPLRRGDGLAFLAIEEDRTVVSADYQREERRLARWPSLGAVVAAPIRAAGEPVGVIMGARRGASPPSPPTPAEIEVAEVLAAHLGSAIDTEAQVRRQRELLRRMGELERMRAGFVMAVSTELRDPLTIVRSVGGTLANRGHDEIDPVVRRALLESMCLQAEALRTTIDALLDFSRFQSERSEANVVWVGLRELLARLAAATGTQAGDEGAVPDRVVMVDAELLQHAIEVLILVGGHPAGDVPRATFVVDAGDNEVALTIRRPGGSAASGLVRSLVSQLVIAAGGSLEDGLPAIVRLPAAPVPHPVGA